MKSKERAIERAVQRTIWYVTERAIALDDVIRQIVHFY